MSWSLDMPGGAFRNRALSTKLRFEAIRNAQTMRFLTTEPGYGKKKGESVTITRILQLPLATRVGETDRLPSGRPAVQTKSISPSQWGFKIPITELERHLSFFDPMDEYQKTLINQMGLTMDVMAADALKQTPIKYVATTTGFNLDTDGSATGVSGRNLGVQDLREIHDYLSDDLNCPPFKNGRYVGILSTKAARGLKNDPEYKDWQAPNTNMPIITGMLPKAGLEGFDLYETNHTAAWSQLAGASTTTGEAMFFGDDAAGLVEIMAPEVRVGIPEELGLFQMVGWVGTLEAFLTWEVAAQARAVHFTSA